ncbi:hypothetical protein L218DRAFT_951511 [Marasmius fiardii PR-910]|nr:hypothetical protein L218DRAFT_951511 [Marasmius fiardii PR-910]
MNSEFPVKNTLFQESKRRRRITNKPYRSQTRSHSSLNILFFLYPSDDRSSILCPVKLSRLKLTRHLFNGVAKTALQISSQHRGSQWRRSFLTFELNFSQWAGFFQGLLNALTLTSSGLLMVRFLLHIRKWPYKRSRMSPSLSAPNGRSPQIRHSEDFGEDPVQAARSVNRTAFVPRIWQGTAMISDSALRSNNAAVAPSTGSSPGTKYISSDCVKIIRAAVQGSREIV